MTVSVKDITYSENGGCSIATVQRPTEDARIPKTQFNSSEHIGGADEVSAYDMTSKNHDPNSGDSSRQLAPGELPTRSLGGMALGDVSKADPSKVVIQYRGVEMQLSEAQKLGLVEVKDGKVQARTLATPAPASAPVRPANLGPEWEQARRENPSADNLLASVISAVSEGRTGPALSMKLEDWNRQMKLGCDSAEQVENIYNGVVNRLQADMARDIAKSDPRIKPDEAFEVVNYLLERMRPEQRTSMMLRKLHGDRGYIREFNRLLNVQIRKEADLAASKTTKK
jgi:hypothetical protein